MNNVRPKDPKPFIIPVFLPHAGCPHRCVFCNQRAITGEIQSVFSSQALSNRIGNFLALNGRQRKPVQVAFYGGNFLGLQMESVKRLLEVAATFVEAGKVDSIRFSTRPDTISVKRLDWLKNSPVTTIELGVQSMDDRVLAQAKRGHTATDTAAAVGLLKERSYEIGLQMMVGLPGDDETRALESVRKIAALKPDFVRIYPTVVLKGSPLAGLYQRGAYNPLALAAAVALTKKLYLIFRGHRIAVIRMGLQASEDLDAGADILAGPYHPAFGQLVYGEIFLDKARTLLKNIKDRTDSFTLRVNPRSLSRLQGIRNQNIKTLQQEFGLSSIPIHTDTSLAEDEVRAV